LFIFGEAGVTAPATNAEFTVTVLPDEHRKTGEKAESVTRYEYVVEDAGEAL
jgi:hypothetical protein